MQPPSKPTRILNGVANPQAVTDAFRAVEETFGAIWLSDPNGLARLQRTWRRNDHLANLELYTLGVAIHMLRKHGQEDWLKRTVKAIRKSTTSHGLITEIIVYAMIEFEGKRLIPAPLKTPAYDFSTSSSGGDTYYLSVKNHDITDTAKEFARRSEQLRKAWRNRLAKERKNLALYLWSEKPLSSDDFELVLGHINGERGTVIGGPTPLKPTLNVKIAALTEPLNLATAETSDTVLVMAPAPLLEQERFQKNIWSAADKFRPLGRNPGQWNVLFMRVHVLADIDYLGKLAEQILSKPGAPLDCIILHQPAYVRDKTNASLLNHSFRVICSPSFEQSRNPATPFRFMPPVGSCSLSAAPMVIFSDDVEAGPLPPNSYLFQQGDIFRAWSPAVGEGLMPLSSPAEGIRQHVVVAGMILSAKGMPIHPDLLLI